MTTKIIPFALSCAEGDEVLPIAGHVAVHGDRISIWLKGGTAEGDFETLAVEQVSGRLRTIIWPTFADDEPAHKIRLYPEGTAP